MVTAALVERAGVASVALVERAGVASVALVERSTRSGGRPLARTGRGAAAGLLPGELSADEGFVTGRFLAPGGFLANGPATLRAAGRSCAGGVAALLADAFGRGDAVDPDEPVDPPPSAPVTLPAGSPAAPEVLALGGFTVGALAAGGRDERATVSLSAARDGAANGRARSGRSAPVSDSSRSTTVSPCATDEADRGPIASVFE